MLSSLPQKKARQTIHTEAKIEIGEDQNKSRIDAPGLNYQTVYSMTSCWP